MRERNHYIGLWLDDLEFNHLTVLCAATGLSTSALVRKLISGTQLRPRPPDQYAGLLRELSAIGNNINQIALWANARGNVRESEVTDAIALVRRAWELVKNGL